jgi:glutamyl-tRNA reductase
MSEVLDSLFVQGISHHKTPLEVREKFALDQEDVRKILHDLHKLPGMKECILLNTCNRMEIYGLADSPDALKDVTDYFCQTKQIEPSLFHEHAYVQSNMEVLKHIIEVSSGLDSQMVGETDIFKQMKEAYEYARNEGTTGMVLNRMFERSFQAAKKARAHTGITRGNISIGNVAVNLASRIFGKLEGSRVLLIGSGEVAEQTAQALISRGVDDITVTSRTYENAHRVAREFSGTVMDFESFRKQLSHFDIIICSTASQDPQIHGPDVKTALRKRRGKPMFLIDLAMPRDVDPAVESLDNVFVYNLDDISKMANENLEQRKNEIDHARKILGRQAWWLWLELRRRSVLPQDTKN